MSIARALAPSLIVLLVVPGCVGDDASDAGGGTAATTNPTSADDDDDDDDDDEDDDDDDDDNDDDDDDDDADDDDDDDDDDDMTGSTSGDTTSGDTTAGDATSGSTDDGMPPDCDPIDDCEVCGAMTGCGWCGATGTCAAGDEAGPSAGVCSGGWVIEGDFFSCPAANCFARTSCGECQDAFSGCGWCASNDTCMPGAPDMPAPGGTCADQQWYFDICPADCADEMTCVSCTATVGCGWCPGGGGCSAGTDAGPLEGACGGGWTTEVGDCF